MQKNYIDDNAPLLEVRNLSCGYLNRNNYREVANGINLRLYRGEINGIIGEIGSGKTTLVRAIEGKIFRSSGDIFFKGESIFIKKNYFKFRKKRVVVKQDSMNALRPRYSVEFQIRKLFKGGEYNENELKRAFDLLNLDLEILNKLPVQLSDGTRHRVLIAMASLVKPEILIVDEPTAGLDIMAIRGMLKLFRELTQTTSIIMISSDIIPIFQVCDRVYVMREGQIIEDGKWSELLDKPHHPYVKDLLESMPSVRNRKREFIENYNEIRTECVYSDKCRYIDERCRERIPYRFDGEHGYRCIKYPEWTDDSA